MQGYGRPRFSVRLAASVLGVLVLLLGITACSVGGNSKPSPIVLPPTDQLSTETQLPTTTTPSGVAPEAPSRLPNWSIGRVIAMAPRADNSRYHQGSKTPSGDLEQTSGFHFSTADRSVRCSTGDADRDTLACRSDSGTPDRRPGACSTPGTLALLDADGVQVNVCGDRYPVRYRSSIVDFGTTISVARFSCLVQTVGVYCVNSATGDGFASTPQGFKKINSADRAPSALVSLAGDRNSGPDGDSSGSTSPQPTR